MLPNIKKNHRYQNQQIYSQTISHNKYKYPKLNFHISYKNLQQDENITINTMRYNNQTPSKLDTTHSPIQVKNNQSLQYKTSLRLEIKQLDKKIRQCQKRLKYSYQSEKSPNKSNKVNKKYQNQSFDKNTFQFLTNPYQKQREQIHQHVLQKKQQKVIQSGDPNFIKKKIQDLQKHYKRRLKKKIERRQAIHQACQKKVPKIYITQKANEIKKNGKPYNTQEHLFRVLTKQVTPQEIYPTIPNFGIVKDNITKHIQAYLSDFKPFIERKQFNKSQNKEERQQKKY